MGKRKYQQMLGEDVDFQWNDNADQEEVADQSVAQQPQQPPRKKHKLQESKHSAARAYLKRKELDPVTNIHREIAANPSSAEGHIKLISYYLATHTVDKARGAARSGLKRLPIDALEPRFRLFSAWVRLEHDYGSQSDQQKVFEKALNECGTLYRQKLFYLKASIYEEKDELDKAEEIYRKVVKKNGKKSEAWDKLFEFLIKQGKHKEAKEELKKSQQALPTKSLKMRAFSIFALKEYKHGSIVEGHKMMENIVATYPNRTDMWSMFIDMELRAERYEQVRKIFERVVRLKMSPKKMKSFLSRYMDFEKNHGDESGVEHVRDIAKQYVERISNE